MGQQPTKKYLVLHDYGYEGWQIVGQGDDIHEAALAREADVSNGGGTVIIVEHIPTLQAYRMASYQANCT